jgi:hypothetical protein
LQQPVPDAPNLLVERIFELLNRCQIAQDTLPGGTRAASALRFACAAFYRPARQCQTRHGDAAISRIHTAPENKLNTINESFHGTQSLLRIAEQPR